MIFKNKNKGFSLVEMIVVVAIIMALLAVLSPALINYIEESRAKRDLTTMNEVTMYIATAMVDQDVYNEVLTYVCDGNVSCYIDSDLEQEYDDLKIITKAPDASTNGQYKFSDESREKRNHLYYAAGNMRGVTITFEVKDKRIKLSDGVINKYLPGTPNQHGNEKTIQIAKTSSPKDDIKYFTKYEPDYATKGTLGTMTEDTEHRLLNKLRTSYDDYIKITSSTYRNSEYTVFINIPEKASIQETMHKTIDIYGQWNGKALKKKQ